MRLRSWLSHPLLRGLDLDDPRIAEWRRSIIRGSCVQSGGVICMIEPWDSRWSRLTYSRLHHELFCPEAAEWGFSAQGALPGANGAQPWIVFERDRRQFEGEFPGWKYVCSHSPASGVNEKAARPSEWPRRRADRQVEI